ncbi:MAG: hypothetical protein AB7F32_02885 [Victivallaceae bacterium]
MKIKTGYLITIIIFSIVILFGMYKFGLFHCLQTWPEYKFLGGNVEDLNNYLKNKNTVLDKIGYDSGIDIFERLSGRKLSPTQTLYRFYGGDEHEFWFFPIGTKTYGLYVVVEDGKIIFFHESVAIDSI